MLVLSRHRDESIVIGGNIKVTIVDIRGDKVRLGIDAPVDVPVHRQEVQDAIDREGQKAKSPSLKKAQKLKARQDPRSPRRSRGLSTSRKGP